MKSKNVWKGLQDKDKTILARRALKRFAKTVKKHYPFFHISITNGVGIDVLVLSYLVEWPGYGRPMALYIKPSYCNSTSYLLPGCYREILNSTPSLRDLLKEYRREYKKKSRSQIQHKTNATIECNIELI
jgi:hypothetical protein